MKRWKRIFNLPRRLYAWTESWAHHPAGEWMLGLIAFAESSFFPIPPDVLLIPLAIQRPRKAFRFATICLIASVLGGIAGYFIGRLLFETLGRPILEFYGALDAFNMFRARVEQYDVWAVGLAGLTPIPYKVATIGAGTLNLDLFRFVIASLIARGMRFYALATVCRLFGEQARNFIDRNFEWLMIGFAVALVGGFIIIKLLV